MKSQIEAAIAIEDVTPDPGIVLSGYAVRSVPFSGIDAPLRCTVLAIRDNNGKTVLLTALDMVAADVQHADEFRDSCAHVAGITRDAVVVNFSHSHASPIAGIYATPYDEKQREAHRVYWKKVLKAGQQATSRAMKELRPARVGHGLGRCDGNINRRQRSPADDIVIGENPNGACDSSVGVVRIDGLDGKPIAIVFRYACHTVTLGPRINWVSPDFVGSARDLLEKTYDCRSLFLQGCAGNINPKSGIGQDGEDSAFAHEAKNRLGRQLGAEVIKVCETIDNIRRREEPVFVESVGRYWMYPYQFVDDPDDVCIEIRHELLSLQLEKLPTKSDLDDELSYWNNKYHDLLQSNAPLWEVGPVKRFYYWAKRRRECLANDKPNPPILDAPLQEIKIGTLRICCIPFEAMAETGMAIAEVHGPNTWVLGFTNGVISYLPTPEISAEGGMEAKLGYKAYQIPSEIPGSCETKIRQWFL